MRNRNSLFLALLMTAVFVFGLAKDGFTWGAATGDASNYRQLQETAIFFNNSGSTLSAGDVVILDTRGAGVSTGTTLGAYVTTTGQVTAHGDSLADHVLAVGVVLHGAADQRPITVVTKGPALTTVDDSSDAVSNNTAVGTSGATSARAGGGTNLGIALEPGDGTDGDQIIIWVSPTGAD